VRRRWWSSKKNVARANVPGATVEREFVSCTGGLYLAVVADLVAQVAEGVPICRRACVIGCRCPSGNGSPEA
jgi:hypothetical protein